MAALRASGDVEVVRTLTTYPAIQELMRTVRIHKPQFAFLCVEDFARAEAIAAQMDDFLPGFPIVAVGRVLEADMMPKLMHLGIREYLVLPLNPARLAEAMESTGRLLKRHPSQANLLADLYTFLPGFCNAPNVLMFPFRLVLAGTV